MAFTVGLEVAVLYGYLENRKCEHCGKVPVRIIEDGVNDLSDGVLKVDVIKDAGDYTWVCGHHPLEPSDAGLG